MIDVLVWPGRKAFLAADERRLTLIEPPVFLIRVYRRSSAANRCVPAGVPS
jgi:hypothetical protein